jgi:DNA-binding NarL/FixJ family response regulator
MPVMSEHELRRVLIWQNMCLPQHGKRGFPNQLTRRETEVLRLVAEGLTDAQIAQKLVLSTGTVSWYVRSICSKLSVSSRTAATRAAIDQKLL